MNLIPKKSLGQHFLHSPSALKKIIDAANIKPGETVLEIGPGTGILTRALLDTGAQVMAIEKDSRAGELLNEKFSKEIGGGQLRLIIGDVLEESLFSKQIKLGATTPEIDCNHSPMTSSPVTSPQLLNGNYALVANIPYYITGAILEKFLEHAPRPNRMILLVQKEVAERIVTRDGKESILSISVKAFGTPRMVAVVPRGAFVPAPSVDSAILEISGISDARFIEKIRDDQKVKIETSAEISRFFEIMKAGFAHKRKFAIRNIESVMSREKAEEIWQKLGLNPKMRAEDMTVEDWVGVVHQYND
jgi:16S rRNA (adenine1518-N6/adenine1519-N6)-dimethyltransferase